MTWMSGEFDAVPAGSPLRVGIVGAGFIGEVHARAAHRSGAVVASVVSSSPSSTMAAVARFGAESGDADATALISRDDIDVVHICTPNHLHVPLALQAIEAGKHVVCEKPLAIDLDGALRVERAAAAAGLVATVPFVYRFYPMVREARVRHTSWGRPAHLVYGSYLQDWLSSPYDRNWRVDPATSGPSRAFADIGSHWCDLVEFVTGDPLVSVCAQFATVYDERATGSTHSFAPGDHNAPMEPVTTEDAALLLFRTAAGAHGSAVISQVSSGHKNQLRFEIVGATASLAFDQEHPDELWIGGRATSEIVSRDAAVVDPSVVPYVTVPPGHPQGYQDCFDLFVADAYRAIAEGSADKVEGLPTFADGRRAASVTGAVLRSAASRRWEDIEAVPEEDPS
jgi:predicted dehydrogenase